MNCGFGTHILFLVAFLVIVIASFVPGLKCLVLGQVSRQCLVHTRHGDDWNKVRGSEPASMQHKGAESFPVLDLRHLIRLLTCKATPCNTNTSVAFFCFEAAWLETSKKCRNEIWFEQTSM